MRSNGEGSAAGNMHRFDRDDDAITAGGIHVSSDIDGATDGLHQQHQQSEENSINNGMDEQSKKDSLLLLDKMMREPWWDFLEGSIKHEKARTDEITHQAVSEVTAKVGVEIASEDVAAKIALRLMIAAKAAAAMVGPWVDQMVGPLTNQMAFSQMAQMDIPEMVFDNHIHEAVSGIAAKITEEVVSEINAAETPKSIVPEMAAPQILVTAPQAVPTVIPQAAPPNAIIRARHQASLNRERGIKHDKADGTINPDGKFQCFCGQHAITNSSNSISSHVSRNHKAIYNAAQMAASQAATPAPVARAIPPNAIVTAEDRTRMNREAGINHAKAEGHIDQDGKFRCVCGGAVKNTNGSISSHISRTHRQQYTRAQLRMTGVTKLEDDVGEDE
ncbi:hypothetical protein GGR53DRAFT_526518 [Hypoxylon sp. FL1150]|nr:hypothetical protein GGR53DRAFT_526518 [Hypoxylon sp. FL1150]